MKKKFLTALVSASVAALALSGCGGKTSESTTAADQSGAAAESVAETAGVDGAKKVLRFGQANAGEGLDMQTSTNSRSASIADEVTESLLRFDDDNNEEPVLLTDFPTASFFAYIKPQAPCVQNNVHCICHSMGGRYIIISKRMMGKV